jgi:hypothetical protein
MNQYPYPVSRLLNLGEPRGNRDWPVYTALGLTTEHVPDLIRVMLDEELNEADSESREVWAPLHAWRALGQLRAVDAVEPLLSLLWRIDERDDDWVGEELPRVFSMIGAPAIPALTAYLADSTHGLFARIAAAHSLEWISRRYSATRAQSLAALSAQLEGYAGQDPTLNAFLISYLLDLKAVEAAPLIERGFAADKVDLSVMGDWEDAQIKLGLKTKREHPRQKAQWWPDLPEFSSPKKKKKK